MPVLIDPASFDPQQLCFSLPSAQPELGNKNYSSVCKLHTCVAADGVRKIDGSLDACIIVIHKSKP
jgi:hypothetical protein